MKTVSSNSARISAVSTWSVNRPSCIRVNSSSSSTIPVSRLASRAMIDAAPRFRVQILGCQKRLTPAGNGCKRRSKLMRHGGNELCLCFFRLSDLDRHIINGADQLADLIVILTGDLHAVGACGDAPGRRVDLRDGHQNGLDKKTAQEKIEPIKSKPIVTAISAIIRI